MFHIVEDLVTQPELASLSEAAMRATWHDGAETTSAAIAGGKTNRQMDRSGSDWATVERTVVGALARDPRALRAARPSRIGGLILSAYGPGDKYAAHFDNPVIDAGGVGLRTDLAFTLFLVAPGDYEGGALAVDVAGIPRRFRLPAGHAVIYPAEYSHAVEPVTRGERLAVVGWIQSQVRDPRRRAILDDLDLVATSLHAADPHSGPAEAAVRAYYALARMWITP